MSDLTESQKIALCAAAGIPYTPTLDSSALVVAVSAQREALRVRDAQFEQIKVDVVRQCLSILKRIGWTRDDLQAWNIKQEEKKKR